MKGKVLRTKEKIEIANLYIEGMTYQEIANEVGVSKNTVYRMIKNDSETKELLKDMHRDYRDEILDLAINEIKEIFLSEEVSTGLKTTLIPTALKFTGAMVDKVEIEKKEPEMDLEALYKEFGIK